MAESNKYLELLNVFKLMSESLDFEYIKSTIIEQAKAVFEAEASSLIFLDKEKDELFFEVATGEKGSALKEIRFPADQGIAGWVIKNKKPLLVADVMEDGRFYREVDKKSSFVTRSIMGTPVWIDGEVIGLIEVLNRVGGGVFEEKDSGLLTIFADMAALNLKNAMWHKDALEKERMESDLRVAGEIQKKLLPDSDMQVPGYEFFSKYKSCRSVGGDYYDILDFGDGRYLIVIADVSGKGAPASIVMSSVRAYLRSAVRFKLKLHEIMNMVNIYTCGDTEAGRFVTMVAGELDTASNTFRYINAGHNYPFIIPQGGAPSALTSNDIPAGIVPDYVYSEFELSFEKGDMLVLYTDGITESADENGVMYGDGAFEKDLCEFSPGKLDGLGHRLFSSALGLSGAVQADDMTLLLLRRV